MGRRIRSLKPEWLEDEKVQRCSVYAQLLTAKLIVMADDYGNGRAGVVAAATAFPMDPNQFEPAMKELEGWYVQRYEIRGQPYYHLLNWQKHQKVQKPGAAHVPGPDGIQRLKEGRAPEAQRTDSGASPELGPETGQTDSGDPPETLRPDMDQDQDLDQDPGECSAIDAEPPGSLFGGDLQEHQEPDDPPVLEYPTTGKVKTWLLMTSVLHDLQSDYDTIDVLAEAKKLRQWTLANPRKRATADGMRRRLVLWLNKAVDFASRRGPGGGSESRAERQQREAHEWAMEASDGPVMALPPGSGS